MKGTPIRYSAEELAWLDSHRDMVISDYHAAFVAAFGRADVSAQNLHALRKRKGWKVGRAPERYRGRNLKYSPVERDWVRSHISLSNEALHAGFVATFGRSDVSVEKLVGLRKRMGWTTGRNTRFQPGQIPANKGKPCEPGRGGRHPNARRTQFCKGQEPHNTKFLGHERVNKDGYVEISVAETNPHTGYHRRYVHKHVHLWTQKNGPVPAGHALKCLDGDKTNCDPDNWEAVPRALLPRLNGRFGRGYDAAPQDLKPTILLVAKLEHARAVKGRGKAGAS